MQCTSCTGSYRVQQLRAQVRDWENCPTTPSSVKQSKVAKLETELAAAMKDDNKGSRLDVTA